MVTSNKDSPLSCLTALDVLMQSNHSCAASVPSYLLSLLWIEQALLDSARMRSCCFAEVLGYASYYILTMGIHISYILNSHEKKQTSYTSLPSLSCHKGYESFA